MRSSQALRLLTAVVLISAVLLASGGSAAAISQDKLYEAWAEAGRRFGARSVLLSSDTEESRWVGRVGDRIAASWPDRRWVTHTFLVIAEAEPKAWSFPVSPVLHRVYVTTGLLQFLKERMGARADDALAGVLGHEMAHLMRDHHLLRHRQAATLESEAPQELEALSARVLGRWQKEDESEADRYGAFYALHAGYRFEGITLFLAQYMRRYGDEVLLDNVGDSSGRVHPSLSDRIAELERERGRIEAAERLFGTGVRLLRAGAWQAAADCFADTRKAFPVSSTVAHDLAYAELKQYEASASTGAPLEQRVSTSYFSELRPKGAPVASAQLLLTEAKADFLRASDLDRSGVFAAPRLGLACAYLYEGEDAKAQACLQEMTVGLDAPEYHNLVGVVAERAGDVAAAQRSYLKALGGSASGDVSPAAVLVGSSPSPHLPALYNLARLLEQKGNTREAGKLYDLYLTFEGDLGAYGTRARDGLLRCGGGLAEVAPREVVDSYRGINLRSSGTLVVKAAVGEPEGYSRLEVGRGALMTYNYGSQGIQVTTATPDKADAAHAVVQYILLHAPNRDPIAGVRVGDSGKTLQNQLGRPREVTSERDGGAWWDYAQNGVAFRVVDDRIEQCLIGGRR